MWPSGTCAAITDRQASQQCIINVQVLGDEGAVKAYRRTLEQRAAQRCTVTP